MCDRCITWKYRRREYPSMGEYESLFENAFGASSDTEEGERLKDFGETELMIFGESPNWESINEINGLWLCRDFLSPDLQSSILSAIDKEGWFTEASHNQAMSFGNLPAWANELSNSIREVIRFSDDDNYEHICPFPLNLLQRAPLFDQLITNTYQPGEGICAHVDLMRFEDGIAIISLESSCVMHFSRANDNEDLGNKDGELRLKVPVYLEPGSLILMWGEARYQWKHEINRQPGCQIWKGKEIDQKQRTSLTLRRLCKSE